MSEDISFDYDDPGLLFDPKLYEPGAAYGSSKVIHSDDEEMDEAGDSSPAEYVANPVAGIEQASSDLGARQTSSSKYPNLQVTQSMLRPQRKRREPSPGVDCYQ